MPVEIEAVLALLPEIFPGVQQIPLQNIRPNPNNPGAPLTDPEIQDLAQNIAQAGLLNPLKVRPDKANPLAGGVQPHPSNPRLRVDNQPWAVGDFNYEILAGENRYRAFGYLKKEAIPGSILNPTAREAVKITHLDNEVRDRGWWAAYQSIEQLIQADPAMTQREIAVELKMNKDKVTRAIGLLPLLNAEAKRLIVRHSDNSNKGIKGISEMAAARLADLGPGGALKPGVKAAGAEGQKLWPYPAIPPETQDLIRRTLEVAIDQQLTEAGVKGLVVWVQDGGNPAEYGKKTQKPGTATSATAPIGAPPRNDSENAAEETDGKEGEGKIKPWNGEIRYSEPRVIPIDRIRVNPTIAIMYQSFLGLDRKVLAMKTTGIAPDITVRSLSAEEKAADPDHDYELFMGAHTLKAAQILGWPSLRAQDHGEIDAEEAVRQHGILQNLFVPLSWIEKYLWIADRVKEKPEKSAAQWAIETQENPDLVEAVLPILKLINEPTMISIIESVQEGYRCGSRGFEPYFAYLLEPLKGISKDLLKIQKVVERVVKFAIEKDLGEEDIEALVEWVLAGHDPEKFEVEAMAE